MKIKSIILASIITAIFVLVACKKDDNIPQEEIVLEDKENPTITVTSPVQCSWHIAGTEVHMYATFSDDLELYSYEVYISDGLYVEDTAFHFHHSELISGKNYEFHKDFVVPNNPYNWRLVFFTVTDKANKTFSKNFVLHFAQEAKYAKQN